VRTAWCWFDLARVLDWLRSPKSEVEAAFLKSRSLKPNETIFSDKYEEWKNKKGRRRSPQESKKSDL